MFPVYVFLIAFTINSLLAVGLFSYVMFDVISKKRKIIFTILFLWAVISSWASLASPELLKTISLKQQKHDDVQKTELATIPPVSKLCVKTTYQSVREEPIVICGEPTPAP